MTADREAVAAVLERAADRIERPGAWTQGAYARDAGGDSVEANSTSATCWCADGALNVETGDYDILLYASALSALGGSVPLNCVVAWNDRPTQTAANVAATMRKAAQAVREGRA